MANGAGAPEPIYDETADGGAPPFVLKLAIVVYLLATLALFGALFVDLWRPESVVIEGVFGASPTEGEHPAVVFRSMLFSVVGGGFGGITFSLLAFNRHVAFRQDFSTPFAWGFFYSPWVASVLGLMVFALVKGGMLVLSGGDGAAEAQEVANLGHLSLGFLAGFGWATFSEKLRRLIREVFGSADGGDGERRVEPEHPPRRAAAAEEPRPAPELRDEPEPAGRTDGRE